MIESVSQNDSGISAAVSRFKAFGLNRANEFHSKGYKRRYFFPHKVFYLPKCGPDAYKMATRMCGPCELNQMWEIILYADTPTIDEFPPELFFDDDLVWHQQQFGKIGQVATANLVEMGTTLYTMVHISDIVQRISRRREYKTRIENRFKGWHHLLLNAILNFALERKLDRVLSPASSLAMRNTDQKRTVQRELFERVYDRNIGELFETTQKDGWWVIELDVNRERIIQPEDREEILKHTKTICLCHDVEAGYGHIEADPPFVDFANKNFPHNLDRMLSIEKKFGVKATYNVLGSLLKDVRAKAEEDGHCIAFHSYNHQFDENEPIQLMECRKIDYRIKGYRPPQSKITAGLDDRHLGFHNFEWLASSRRSFGFDQPQIVNRIVKIPIYFDDFQMYKEGLKYEDWESLAMERINRSDPAVFCLHDCYAHLWLPYYEKFLEKILRLGKMKTLNTIAAEVAFENAI